MQEVSEPPNSLERSIGMLRYEIRSTPVTEDSEPPNSIEGQNDVTVKEPLAGDTKHWDGAYPPEKITNPCDVYEYAIYYIVSKLIPVGVSPPLPGLYMPIE